MSGMRLDVHVVALEGDFERALEGLEYRFGMPRTTARRFLESLPRVAKHQADPEEAKAYRRVLTELGARVELRSATSVLPSSALVGDLPSLPVPAHGPGGATPSMQNFASSARLANTVPRAPAIPKDLVPRFETPEFEPEEVERLMISPAPPEIEDSLDGSIDFRGLTSVPAEEAAHSLPGGPRSGATTNPVERERERAPHDGAQSAETPRQPSRRSRRPRWATKTLLAALTAAAGALAYLAFR